MSNKNRNDDTMRNPDWSGAEPPWPAFPAGADLRDARLLAGLDPLAIVAWTGKHRTSWRRMERGQTRVCLACYHLAVILSGACPWPAWRGWMVVGDRLYPPEDRTRGFSGEEVRTVGCAWALAADARAQAHRTLSRPEPPRRACRAATHAGAPPSAGAARRARYG